MKKYLAVLLFVQCVSVHAQNWKAESIRDYNKQQASRLLKEYVEFVSIPNVARDTVNVHKNADFIAALMRNRGIKNVQLLQAETKGVHPVVYGEVLVPGAKNTLIFYAHYDGQPVNAAQWAAGLSPFVPQLFSAAIDKGGAPVQLPTTNDYNPEWRLYARSASDDKAGVYAILSAYDALIKSGQRPASNLKFFFEGEEEAGSVHLSEYLDKYKSLLQSDLWIICDGPVHQTGKKQIYLGVRGDAGIDVTVYASKRPLQSVRCTVVTMATGRPTLR